MTARSAWPTLGRRRRRLAALLVVSVCLAGCGKEPADLSAIFADQPPPSNGENLVAIADRTLANGDTDAALDLYRQAASISAPGALQRLGQVLFARGEYDYAAGAFGEALIRQPHDALALRGLGASELAQGQFDEAEKTIEEAVRQDADIRSVRDLAVLRVFQGQTDEARAVYRKALARWPQDLSLRSNYALFEALADNCDQAVKTGREAATSPFVRPQQVAAFALVLAACGREAEAKEFGRQVMSGGGVDKLLQQGNELRQADGLAARAAVIGVVPPSENGVMAPDGKPALPVGAAASVN